MSYKRVIRFQYCRIRCRRFINDAWGDKEPFNLVNLIDKIQSDNLLLESIEFNKVLARVEKISYIEDDDIWGLRFMKLRDSNVPSMAKSNQEAEPIELEDDEYIGEDITMLYERKSSVAMIQANRFSLGISRLEEFFNKLYNDENIRIFIDPINQTHDDERIQKGRYRYLELSFANLQFWGEVAERYRSLSTIISPIRKMGGYSGNIKISIGRKKNDTLDKNEVQDVISELKSNKRFIRSAKMKVADDDDTDVEIIDLFEDVFHDFITYVLENRETLNFNDAIMSMKPILKKRREEIYKEIHYIPE